MIMGVREEGDHLVLELSDATEEKLNPATFTVGRNNVPYVLVKKTEDRARFTRPAYYQLTNYLVEGSDGAPALKIGNRLYDLDTKAY